MLSKHVSISILCFSLLSLSSLFAMEQAVQPQKQSLWERVTKGVEACGLGCGIAYVVKTLYGGIADDMSKYYASLGNYNYRPLNPLKEAALPLGCVVAPLCGVGTALAAILATKAIQGKKSKDIGSYVAPVAAIGVGTGILTYAEIMSAVHSLDLVPKLTLGLSGIFATAWGATKIFQNLRQGK